ncbi:MAG TPA: nucleosidase [Chloroflexota bacterium]
MELIGTLSPERPLLVMAVREEAQGYDYDLPLLLTGPGKVNAAAALATVLARGPEPSGVINLGTAGALRSGWTGTQVISTVIQHDLDSELLRQLTGETYGEPLALADQGGATLATGDVFVSDPVVRTRLAARAALVDMEGYALAAVSKQARVPIRIIKYVSDQAGEGAAKTWQEATTDSARALSDWVAANLIDKRA